MAVKYASRLARLIVVGDLNMVSQSGKNNNGCMQKYQQGRGWINFFYSTVALISSPSP
jgi:hypothetical protein